MCHPPPILLYWKQDYNSQNSKAEYDNEDWVSSYLQTPLSISLNNANTETDETDLKYQKQ